MRAGILGLVCVLAACEESNGTYFVVEGGGIKFDQLDFYLGKDHGTATPFTPARPLTASSIGLPAERQRLTKRMWSESDHQTMPPTTSFSYYLTPDPQNQFPHYAMVVASYGGQVVGLAEIEDFNVKDDAAYIYTVPLAPADQGFERWGDPESIEHECVRWTRARGEDTPSTYVVSRDGDRDCDGTPEKADCDDLSYCARENANCTLREANCITDTCDLGTCTDGAIANGVVEAKTCEPRTCLPDAFCSAGDACDENGPPGEFLACAMTIDLVHTEVTMPVEVLGGRLCSFSFDVYPPYGLDCAAPAIAWPPLGKVGAWTFRVDRSANTPEACAFTLSTSDQSDPPPDVAHLLVTVAASMQRTSFVIGFQPNTVAPISCGGGPVVKPGGAATTCP